MFVRIYSCRSKGRGLGKLLLLASSFYLPPALAQEIVAVEPPPGETPDSDNATLSLDVAPGTNISTTNRTLVARLKNAKALLADGPGADISTLPPADISGKLLAQQDVSNSDADTQTSVAEQRDEGDVSGDATEPDSAAGVIYRDQLPAEDQPAQAAESEAVESGTEVSDTEAATETVTDEATDGASAAPAEAESGNRHIERFGSSTTEEWEMDLSVPTPAPVRRTQQVSASALPDAAQNQELQSLLGTLAIEPNNEVVIGQLNSLLTDVLNQVNVDLDAGLLGEAGRALNVIQPIEPNLRGLRTAQTRLRRLGESRDFLRSGEAALEANLLIQPENDNAFYFFDQAKTRDPNSAAAELGLARVQEGLIERATAAADIMDFELAEQWLVLAEGIRDNQTLVDGARALMADQQRAQTQKMANKVDAAIDAEDFDGADLLLIELIALGGQEDTVTELRTKLEDARYYSGFQPGQIISDAFLDGSDKAPDIVIIPSGSFMMGSEGDVDNEKPRHRVNIERGFGIGVTEVTVSQFRLFVLRSGYRTVAEIGGSSKIYNEAVGRLTPRSNVTWLDGYNGDRASINSPVIHISWHDAQAYVRWLSEETGKKYRLPTEAEYEYVARAGTNTDYWWGNGTPTEAIENLTGEDDESPEGRQWTTFFDDYEDGYWGPASVASLKNDLFVHPFGVYDIAGNVSEWVEDCWHSNYSQAPDTGAAWVNLGCERRVARGGYWASAPSGSRAAFRISANPNTVGPVVGIRIARDL